MQRIVYHIVPQGAGSPDMAVHCGSAEAPGSMVFKHT